MAGHRQHILVSAAWLLLLASCSIQAAPTSANSTASATLRVTTNDPSTFNATTCTCLASLAANGNYELSTKIQFSCSNGFYVQIKSALIATRLTRFCGSEKSECSIDEFLSSEIQSNSNSNYSFSYSVGSCFQVTQVWSCNVPSSMYPISPSSSDSSSYLIYYIEALLVVIILTCIFMINQKRLRRKLNDKIVAIKRKNGNDRWYSKLLNRLQELLKVPVVESPEEVVPEHRPRTSLPIITMDTSYLNVIRTRNTPTSQQVRSRQQHRTSLPHIFSKNLAWGFHRRFRNGAVPTPPPSPPPPDANQGLRNDPAVVPEASLQLANIPFEQLWMSEEPPPNYDKAFDSSIDPQLPPNYTSTVAHNRKLIRNLFSSRNPTNRIHPFVVDSTNTNAALALDNSVAIQRNFAFNIHQIEDDIILGNFNAVNYLNISSSSDNTTFSATESTTSFTSYSND